MACVAKLLVLDGFSLAFRAFFALPETMITSSGQYTNAIHGFTSMLLNLVKDHQPTHIAVAFDHPDPTFRDKLSPQYKGTRKKAPESLLPQLSLIGHVVESLGIPARHFDVQDCQIWSQGTDHFNGFFSAASCTYDFIPLFLKNLLEIKSDYGLVFSYHHS